MSEASSKQKQKLYCYVDETGQDTEGQLFLVAVVVVGEERELLRAELLQIEEMSGKGTKKWTRATGVQRIVYMRSVLANHHVSGKLYCSIYPGTKAYIDLTILSAAKAVQLHASDVYSATILVDGLHRNEQRRFATGLRQLRVKVAKVRGLRDETDVFIRLADALAGFVRDGHSQDRRMEELYRTAINTKKVHLI